MRRLMIVLIVTLAAGCGGPSLREAFGPQTRQIDPSTIRRVLRSAPVSSAEDFHAETLLLSEEFSAHLLQFRTAEQRHIHRRHDMTTIVQRGVGDLYIGQRRYRVSRGDVFHIPRGTPHYAVNRGDEPLVVVNIFTPPYGGEDSIAMPVGARSYER